MQTTINQGGQDRPYEIDVLDTGGHLSERGYGTPEQSLKAMKDYTDWFRDRRKNEPDRAIDWVGKALILDEIFYETFNQEPLGAANHAGGMSYNQKEDLWQHQNADIWIVRWKSHDIYKKFKIDLLQWFDLPYAEADWLLKRASEEDIFVAKRREEAENENPGNGDLPNLGDMADAFTGLSDED